MQDREGPQGSSHLFSRVHPYAYVAPWVHLGKGCVIHPFAVVGKLPDHSAALARQPEAVKELHIGSNVVIGAHAVICGGVMIGDDCIIGDHASIREGCVVGNRCVVGRAVSLHYDVELADDVRLVDTTHITGGCKIGEGCFFGVGVITSNDRNIDLHNYGFHGAQPPIFGKRVMVGSGANILAGVRVGDDALIGAGALVVTDVPNGARVLGQKAVVR